MVPGPRFGVFISPGTILLYHNPSQSLFHRQNFSLTPFINLMVSSDFHISFRIILSRGLIYYFSYRKLVNMIWQPILFPAGTTGPVGRSWGGFLQEPSYHRVPKFRPSASRSREPAPFMMGAGIGLWVLHGRLAHRSPRGRFDPWAVPVSLV